MKKTWEKGNRIKSVPVIPWRVSNPFTHTNPVDNRLTQHKRRENAGNRSCRHKEGDRKCNVSTFWGFVIKWITHSARIWDYARKFDSFELYVLKVTVAQVQSVVDIECLTGYLLALPAFVTEVIIIKVRQRVDDDDYDVMSCVSECMQKFMSLSCDVFLLTRNSEETPNRETGSTVAFWLHCIANFDYFWLTKSAQPSPVIRDTARKQWQICKEWVLAARVAARMS